MELDIEAAAKKLAECMDYPWGYMPEEGKRNMHKHAESIVKAALSLTEEKHKCKDYGHAGPKCGADDCWLRNE